MMKQYSILFLLLLFTTIAGDEKPLYQTIAELRALQLYAPVSSFRYIDKFIAEKQQLDPQDVRSYCSLYIWMHYIPYGIWQLFCISSLWGLLVLIILQKNIYRKIYIIIFLISGLACLMHYYYSHQRWALVKDNSFLLGSPQENSFIRRTLGKLQEVYVLKNENDWSQIKVRDMIGWIKTEKLYELRK
jgi:hypothetical protein